MKFWTKMLFAVVLAVTVACVPYSTDPDVVPPNNRCNSGSCFIRSANVCCPYPYTYYGGAAYGCYTNQSDCLRASGGKCWYETTCIP